MRSAQLRPRKPASSGASEAEVSPPALAPLATQQQVVKAVTTGRRDPFGAVLTPILTLPPEAAPNVPAKAGPTAAHTVLSWPESVAFEGVLQTKNAESEALVRYTPAEAKDAVVRYGSLRVGDLGTGDADSLLPPGWQVVAIDADRGKLMLGKGGQTLTRELPKP